jgi:hypothetical protein
MKSKILVSKIIIVLVATTLISSCSDDDSAEELTPTIEVVNPDINVGYKTGETVIPFSSNVILYANVDPANQNWLSYRFEDNCKTLVVKYIENNTTDQRVGHITLSKSGVGEILTITQQGNPDATGGGGLEKVDLEFIVDNSSGYAILFVTPSEIAKIPVGATLVMKCSSDEGSISLLNPNTFAEYAGGSPVNGEFKFVWTQEIAEITSTAGMTGMLNNGFNVSSVSCLYEKSNVEFIVDNSSGYTMLIAMPDEVAKISVGAIVVLECPSDVGSIGFVNPSNFQEYAGGSPINGKFTFKWTSEIANITAGTGLMGLIRDGFNVSSMYFISVKTDLEYIIDNSSGYTILALLPEEVAKIPIGATIMLECAGDAGSVSFVNPSDFAEYAGGSPVNGTFSFVWTKEMVAITRSTGMMAILRDGLNVSGMYCHN